MTESIYKEYENKYYNPNDKDKKPGDNDNWKSIQEGFHRIGSTQLETSAGLTLGKGTEDETSVTAAELEEIKNPSQLETSGGLTLGKGTADEVSVTPAELEAMKSGGKTIINSVMYIPVNNITGNAGDFFRFNSIGAKFTGLKSNTRYRMLSFWYNGGATFEDALGIDLVQSNFLGIQTNANGEIVDNTTGSNTGFVNGWIHLDTAVTNQSTGVTVIGFFVEI